MHEVQWTDEKIGRMWDYYADHPAYQRQYFSFHSGEYVLDYIDRHIDLKRMKAVLDFGCGPGHFLKHLLDRLQGNGNVYGLDFSESTVKQARKKFEGHPKFGKIVHVGKLPSSFERESMDLIISIEVVEHLSDGQVAESLGEMYRLLRPGGYLVITTPNQEDLETDKTICPDCGCIFHRWQHVRTWSARELKSCLESGGFKTVRVDELCFGSRLRRYLALAGSLLRATSLQKPHLAYIGTK